MSYALLIACSLLPAQAVPITIVNSGIFGRVVGRTTASRPEASDLYFIEDEQASTVLLTDSASATAPGATANAECTSQGDVGIAQLTSFTSSTAAATCVVPPGGNSLASAGKSEPGAPGTLNQGWLHAQVGTLGGGPDAWVFSDVWAETNCDGADYAYSAGGVVRVYGPGSASGEGDGLLVEIISKKFGPQLGASSQTDWLVSYYDENGQAIVEEGSPAVSSFSKDFVARTPQKVAQGTVLEQVATYADTLSTAQGFYDFTFDVVRTGSAQSTANGGISVSANQ